MMKRIGKSFIIKTNVILLLALISFVGYSTTYYVSNDGNDSNSGRSTQEAWLTLSKVSNSSFTPGDAILFRRGDSWFGTLRPQSGNSSGHITYGAYGSGTKPILHCSIELNEQNNWVEISNNIWETSRNGVLGQEILSNTSFDSGTENWSFWSAADASTSISRDDAIYYSAPASLKVECSTNGSSSFDIQVKTGSPLSLESGKPYELSFYARCTHSFNGGQVTLMQASSPWASYNVASQSVNITTSWSLVKVNLVANTTAGDGMIYITLGNSLPEGSTLHIDDVSFKESLGSVVLPSDVGNIIFNNEGSCGIKCINSSDLNSQGEFWYDAINQSVRFYSQGNPSGIYNNIRIVLGDFIIRQNDRNYLIYEDLWLRYGAGHGIGGGNTHHIIVRNCDISYMGGRYLPGYGDGTTRYGNGVEFWGAAHDNLVEGCRLWEIYDAALTNQSSVSGDQLNIIYKNNVIWNSEYSFEFFNWYPSARVDNIQFINNTCLDAGYGWGHGQRPDPSGRHVCFWEITQNISNMVVENNIFQNAKEYLLYMPDNDFDIKSQLHLNHNCYDQNSGDMSIVEISGNVNTFNKDQFNQYKSTTGFDSNSIGRDPQLSGFNLLGNSDCIDAGNPQYPLDPDNTVPDMGALYYHQ